MKRVADLMTMPMRETFDDLWIIDLEGDNLGARKTENIFAIRSPVAIAIGVRSGPGDTDTPARVQYTRLTGTSEEKLAALDKVETFSDLDWRGCLSGWLDPFLPRSDREYWSWPLLTDLFPWQENGMQFKRTWPIGESKEVLQDRWSYLLRLDGRAQKEAMRETSARRVTKPQPDLVNPEKMLPAITELGVEEDSTTPIRYAYRSFDRQWVLRDNRICDRPRPTLQRAHGEKQIYLTSMLTNVLGTGPAAVATALLPDMDHFRGSFGAKHVIPLYCDRDGEIPNITGGVLETLNEEPGIDLKAESLFAYCYALLSSPDYVQEFWDELTIPGPRVPITRDPQLFAKAAVLGKQLIWLHTFGERLVPKGERAGRVPSGRPRCERGTPTATEKYPEEFSYNADAEELHVGEGVFSGVSQEIWEFEVSGLQVLQSWLSYRMKKGAGRKSSPLDDIRPQSWEFDNELLELLWVLDQTVDLQLEATQLLRKIVAGETVRADELPLPSEAERKGPAGISQRQARLL